MLSVAGIAELWGKLLVQFPFTEHHFVRCGRGSQSPHAALRTQGHGAGADRMAGALQTERARWGHTCSFCRHGLVTLLPCTTAASHQREGQRAIPTLI